VLLDSVIIIDHFNGVPAATAYLLKMHARLAISVITRAEVLTGSNVEKRNWCGACWIGFQS
jgi:predicted nucleic acid-binding protein